MLKKLISIANSLDEKGYSKYADMIDIIAAEYRTSVARPVSDFVEDLKKGFANAAASESSFPTISDKSLNEIYNVIDIVLEHGRSYTTPGMSNLQEWTEEVEEGIVPLVEGMVELENSIKQLTQQKQQISDPAELADLERELNKEHITYQQLLEKVETLRTGRRREDQDKYQKFVTLLEKLRKERGV